MRVRCYYNLHKKKISVLAKTKAGWRLVDHASEIKLTNVKFLVSKAGRLVVLKNKRKNVHAYVEGDFKQIGVLVDESRLTTPVRYNPYLFESFVLNDGTPILTAESCRIFGSKVYISNEKEIPF